nr:unnamed protein product [Digitaria exilis]
MLPLDLRQRRRPCSVLSGGRWSSNSGRTAGALVLSLSVLAGAPAPPGLPSGTVSRTPSELHPPPAPTRGLCVLRARAVGLEQRRHAWSPREHDPTATDFDSSATELDSRKKKVDLGSIWLRRRGIGGGAPCTTEEQGHGGLVRRQRRARLPAHSKACVRQRALDGDADPGRSGEATTRGRRRWPRLPATAAAGPRTAYPSLSAAPSSPRTSSCGGSSGSWAPSSRAPRSGGSCGGSLPLLSPAQPQLLGMARDARARATCAR